MGFDAAILGLVGGLVAGAVMASGKICFNSATRKAVFDRSPLLIRIFAIAVAIQLLVLPILNEIGLVDLHPGIGLFPVAQVIGGLIFGIGMALAGGCIAGILWKTGGGSIATAIAILGFIVGELIIRGPAESIAADLDGAVDPPADFTLQAILGVDYLPLALIVGVVGLALLLRGDRSGLHFGAALAGAGILTWILAQPADYGYGLGFVGAPDNAQNALSEGDLGLLSFQVFLGIGVIAGAAAALRGGLKMPDAARSGRALLGGLMMGVGGTLAHGCNIGNGLTGVPLLSLGSILATAMMALGVILTWHLALRDRPGLRGSESPDVDW